MISRLLKNTFNKRTEKRAVIIHNHIFKNAGSTIDWSLKKYFGRSFIDHRDDKKMQKGAEYLREFMLKNQHLNAISTHHLHHPLPLIKNVELLPLMMFRNPIERVTSVYNFERKQVNSNTLGARYARQHSLREYVHWRMRFDVPPTIRNFHAFRCLAGNVQWTKAFGETELEKAKAYIDSIALLGIVEKFNESVILFENYLNGFFKDIDICYRIQNVGQKNNYNREQRINRLRDEIGESSFELLINRNKVDIELYNYVRSIFKARLKKVRHLSIRIEDLEKRCHNLVTA